ARLQCADGVESPFDTLFWCTGAAAAPWIAESGLATDEQGFLQVRDTLQAKDDDSVFGAGDIATQVNHPRPKAGVYAVRMGPVLAHNLRAQLLGQPLRVFRPQRRFLSLLSLGDRRATANRGPFSATGAWVWRWKDSIDRSFMARFEQLPTAMDRIPSDSLSGVLRQPHCGGCGAKVGADALGTVLQRLQQAYPRYCMAERDDAVALHAPAGVTVVQSIDTLRQLVSDPWIMGRIAANHALSDLYACGAFPISALASVTLPYATEVVQERELYQLLAGALHEFSRADCQLLGGHSMQGHELGLGFVVNGIPLSAEKGLLQKVGSGEGDKLILTKPIGSGVLFAAHMQLQADGRDLECVMNTLLQSNGEAARLALVHGASACTDITGFGLAGHLLEMLQGELGARLTLDCLPLMPGAVSLFQAGFHSTMQAPNQRNVGSAVQLSVDEGDARLAALFDPQTSGGLLISIATERAPDLLAALREADYRDAQVIGEIIALPPHETKALYID
ncbi:MAG: selenide, water dikinase SelD, partial [Halieaceae bacterium]|nr:selenide, water dikinase SelD [Halieaceae bacterium]